MRKPAAQFNLSRSKPMTLRSRAARTRRDRNPIFPVTLPFDRSVLGLPGSRVGDIGIQLGRPVNAPIGFFDDSRECLGAIFVRATQIDDFPGRYARDER